MASFEVEIKKNNVKKIIEMVDVATRMALSLMGEVVEGHAKDNCPVDTGNLRNSITHRESGQDTEVVGTNVYYAPYVEFMDISHKVGQAHYLRDGAQNHIGELQETADAVFKALELK